MRLVEIEVWTHPQEDLTRSIIKFLLPLLVIINLCTGFSSGLTFPKSHSSSEIVIWGGHSDLLEKLPYITTEPVTIIITIIIKK